MAEAAPSRDAMDLVEEEPVPEPMAVAPGTDPEAPYGRKKDGTPAKRRGRQPGWRKDPNAPSRARTSYGKSLETQIAGFLWTVNIPLQLIPALQKDALDTTEVLALAKAIDDECQRNARFRKAVEQALAVQGGTNLIVIVGLILGRRAIRHGLIPIPDEVGGSSGADQLLGAVVGMAGAGQKFDPNLFMPQQTSSAEANA